jgi:hypothetical protein
MSDRNVFTTSATVTVNQYLQNIKVFLIGGGASGTGAFYAGGGAGYITTATYPGNLSPGQTVTVTIGAGGAATAAGNTSEVNNGGTTTINIAGTSYSAQGGKCSMTSAAINVGSSGGGGGGNSGSGGNGGSGGSNGNSGATYPGGVGMGTAAFNAAINFMSGYNIYNIRAGGGGGPSGGTHAGGGGAGGVITGTIEYPLAFPSAGGAGYGAGGRSGGLNWYDGGNPTYYAGGAGAPGLVYMWADTIPPSAPSLTFNNMNVTYGNGAFGISQPSTNSGGSFNYSVIGGSSVSISGTTVTILGVGTTTVRASQAAWGNFFAGSVDGTIVVSKATPSLTVSKNRYITKYILNGTINFDVFSTNAEAGFTRQFSSNNGGIISIPNSASPSATITGSGKTTINVTQTTTTNYNAVTVNQIITFIIVGPSTAYSSEDMTSMDLTGTNLSGCTFSSCNLTSATLYNATVNSSTNLSSSTLTTIRSGRITGVTTLLPPNYTMI